MSAMTDQATLFGDQPQLHDRIAGRKGDFDATVTQIRQGAQPVLAIDRRNAFHLSAVFARLAQLLGKPGSIETFSPSPAATIATRFTEYFESLSKACQALGVQIRVHDHRLPLLLDRVQALASTTHEVELLRLLGIVCDTAFVGPHWFVFETINACNADCLYCNIHAPARTPARDFLNRRLPFALFASTCDDLAAMGVDGLTILANGEPLLHPDFSRMAQYAKGKGLLVDFFTNGLLLDQGVARTVVDAGVDAAYVTISAATEPTYLSLHSKQKPGDFEKVLGNLAALRNLKQQQGASFPEVTGVHVICSANYREVLNMAVQAADLGFARLRPALIRLDDFNRELALTPQHIAFLREQLPELESFCREQRIELWDGFRFQLEHADDPRNWSGDAFVRGGCFIGWGLGLIKANADVSFCCVVKPVANLAGGDRFGDIWSGAFYQHARLAAKNLTENRDLTFADGSKLYTPACRHCDNHDINALLHRRLKETELDAFLNDLP